MALLLSSITFVEAASVSVQVNDQEGKPVSDAVVYAEPQGASPSINSDQVIIIDQIDKTYVPHVSIVPVNTAISFPNKDNIRHHVYSFSPAKKFELPLYEGTPTNPVTFDQAGTVVLGCNIHDWMKAYIYVVDTPYYARTDASGHLSLENVPDGEYKLVVMHPRLATDPESLEKKLSVNGADITESYTLELKPKKRIRRAPKGRRKGYM